MTDSVFSFGKLIAVVIVLVLIFVSFGSWFTVGTGERAVLVRFGNPYSEVYTEGIHAKMPWLDDVAKINIKTIRDDTKAEASSKDLQVVNTDISLNFAIDPTKIIFMLKNIGDENQVVQKLVTPAIQEAVKATTAKFTAVELITKRADVREGLKTLLTSKLSKYGVNIEEVNIMNFKFSPEFDKSIEQKVKAEQDALTAQNKLAQFKFEADQKIETARGTAESTILQAKAQAEAIRIQSEAIQKNGGDAYVELQRIDAWKSGGAQVPKIITSGNGMIMNLDSVLK